MILLSLRMNILGQKNLDTPSFSSRECPTMELWTLVRSKIHWSNVVEVDVRCECGQFETIRKVALS